MKKNPLDSIEVKTPCYESWNEMIGSNEVRFCSHCAKDVHDLSAMTRRKAEALIQKARGKICVRYVKNPDGKILNAPAKFTQIKRRATIAAGVLAASLALSANAYSQNEPVKSKINSTQADNSKSPKNEQNQDLSTIFGTVSDKIGAVIPGAKVSLSNASKQILRQTRTDTNGLYELTNIEPNIYELQIESPGFKKFILENIVITKDLKLEKSINLEIIDEAVVGLIIIDELPKVPEAKINDNIQQREILELPRNTQTFTTMGLIANSCPVEKTKKTKSNKIKKKKRP